MADRSARWCRRQSAKTRRGGPTSPAGTAGRARGQRTVVGTGTAAPRAAARYERQRLHVRARGAEPVPRDAAAERAGGRSRDCELGDRHQARRAPARRARRAGGRHRAVRGDGRQLRAKPGGAEHRRSPSATWPRRRSTASFTLAYLVVNTITNRPRRTRRSRARNVAAHLAPGGCSTSRLTCPSCGGCRRASTSCTSSSRPRRSWGVDEYDVVAQARSRHHSPKPRRSSVERVHDPVPLRVARRARSDGAARRACCAAPLGTRAPARSEARRNPSIGAPYEPQPG